MTIYAGSYFKLNFSLGDDDEKNRPILVYFMSNVHLRKKKFYIFLY